MTEWNPKLTVHQSMAGLSFLARAVFATAYALTVEGQSEVVAVSGITSALAISDDAWNDAYAELYAAGILFTHHEDTPSVQLMCGEEVLAISIGPPGRPAAKEWQRLTALAFANHDPECVYCGATEQLTVDHVRPLQKGGSNHPVNLVPACKSCNSAKGAKNWMEWWPVSPRGREFGRRHA